MNYYGVKKGRNPGIYKSWEECSAQVSGYSGAVFKKFKTLDEAEDFVGLKSSEYREPSGEGKIPLYDDLLISYVDGSYRREDMSYSFGVVIIEQGKISCYSQRFEKDQYSKHRNVSGELRGACFAMDYALKQNYRKLRLHYDYKGVESWASQEWKANNSLTKSYVEYFKKIADKVKVEFIKVEAHAGVVYNELADKLAKEADFKLKKKDY